MDEDCNLDIFEKMTRTSESTKTTCQKSGFKWMAKISNVFSKYETMFPIVVNFSHQILKIVESQIERNRIFSLIRIHANIRKCHLQSDNLNDLSSKIGPMT